MFLVSPNMTLDELFFHTLDLFMEDKTHMIYIISHFVILIF